MSEGEREGGRGREKDSGIRRGNQDNVSSDEDAVIVQLWLW